jgi:tetratricopeptide (TPR) repeat protein
VSDGNSDFTRLWTDGEQTEEDASNPEHPLRWVQVIALGKSLGQLHIKGVIHGDTHERNFLFDDETMTVGVVDFGRSQLLYGPGEPAECATDLIPLMMGFTRRDWYNFKRGYLLSWPDGDRVFDLIEDGDRTGWMQALRRADFQLALTRLDEAQQLVDTDAMAELARLGDRRTWCYRKLGKYDLALSSQTKAITQAEEARTPDVSWYILNLVVLYYDAGHLHLALSALKKFLARTDYAADNEQAVSQGRKLMQVISAGPRPPIGREDSGKEETPL